MELQQREQQAQQAGASRGTLSPHSQIGLQAVPGALPFAHLLAPVDLPPVAADVESASESAMQPHADDTLHLCPCAAVAEDQGADRVLLEVLGVLGAGRL